MKEIPLNNSNLTALVDDEDYDFLVKLSWTLDNGYVRHCSRSDRRFMHQIILGFTTLQNCCDHKNGVRRDNRRSNIVVTTVSRNAQGNKRRGSSSKYVGVSFIARDNSYQVQCKKDGRSYYVGRFATEELAALAYNRKAIELYGPNVHRLNKVEENLVTQ